jgi:glutamyl-tRNA synthetase
MRNFLALLGWSPGNDDEIVTMEEMIARFSLEAIQSKPAVFDPAKLEWMNGQYLSMLPASELHDPVVRQLERMGVNWHDAALDPIIDAVKARARTVTSVAEQVATRLPGATVVRDAKGEALVAKMGEQFTTCLALARAALAAVPPGDWQLAPLEAALKETAEREGLKLGDVMQPVRVALTGGTVSEPVNELLAVVGREESLRRMR